MTYPLLLDEMFSGAIAEQLRAKGHDVLAVVANPALVALPDEQILARAASTGRALVTANIKDFVSLDGRYRAASQAHAGLILVSAQTFPQDRSYTAAITSALSALLDQPAPLQPGQVTFLPGDKQPHRPQVSKRPGTDDLSCRQSGVVSWVCLAKLQSRIGSPGRLCSDARLVLVARDAPDVGAVHRWPTRLGQRQRDSWAEGCGWRGGG